MVKRLDGTIDVNEIVPINILEVYQPTVTQYGFHYSASVSQLLLTGMAGIFSVVQAMRTAPQLEHQRVGSSTLHRPIPLTCQLTGSLAISGPRSTIPGLSAAFWGKPHTTATPPRPSMKFASRCSRTGGTGSLHCWDRSMGSRTCLSRSGMEGLPLVPAGLT